MIQHVRLLGRSWSPDIFQRCGWRGLWLRLLNAIRWRLEIRVQWHAQYLLKSRLGENIDHLWEEWKQDLQPPTRTFSDRAPVLMHPDGARKSTTRLGTVTETRDAMARMTADRRSKRYASGRRRYVMYDVELTEENTNAQDAETDDGRTAARSEDGESDRGTSRVIDTENVGAARGGSVAEHAGTKAGRTG